MKLIIAWTILGAAALAFATAVIGLIIIAIKNWRDWYEDGLVFLGAVALIAALFWAAYIVTL